MTELWPIPKTDVISYENLLEDIRAQRKKIGNYAWNSVEVIEKAENAALADRMQDSDSGLSY